MTIEPKPDPLLTVLTSINFCFVSYAEISTTQYSSNCVCSFLEPDQEMSNYFILVTYWFNSAVILIPVNSSVQLDTQAGSHLGLKL